MFGPFMRLPPEIRRLIWVHCLPQRVIEFDSPYGNFYNPMPKVSFDNAAHRKRPRIAHVCREAAQLVQEAGRNAPICLLLLNKSIGVHAWIQPNVDCLAHINFASTDEEDEERIGFEESNFWGSDGYIDVMFYGARDYQLSPSIMSRHIVDFDLNAEKQHDFEIPTELPHPHLPRSLLDVTEYALDNEEYDFRGHELHIQLFSIFLHLDQDTISQSGLFGLLGDSLIQPVDVHDTARIQSFMALLDVNAEKHVTEVGSASWAFTQALKPDFAAKVQYWKEVAEWAMMVYAWVSHRDKIRQGGVLEDLQTMYNVWSPVYTPEQTHFQSNIHRLNGGHPWVLKTRPDLLQLRPQVLIRTYYKKPNKESCRTE